MSHAPRMNFYAASPDSVQSLVAFSAMASRALEPRLVELVRLRISQINACAFCMDMHAAALIRLGVDARHLNTVAGWRDAPRLFSEREQAALAWAEAVNAIPQRHPSDEEFRALHDRFTEEEITELSCAIAAIRAFNMLNVSFQTPLPDQPFVVAKD